MDIRIGRDERPLDSHRFECSGMIVEVELVLTDEGPCLRLGQPETCILDGEVPGEYYLRPVDAAGWRDYIEDAGDDEIDDRIRQAVEAGYEYEDIHPEERRCDGLGTLITSAGYEQCGGCESCEAPQ